MCRQPPSAPNLYLKVAERAAWACAVLLLAAGSTLAQQPLRQGLSLPPMRQAAFHAVAYDVYVSLQPATQSLTAKATVDFEARQPSRTVQFELHPALHISAVRDANGRMAEVQRDDRDPKTVSVTLGDAVPAGQKTRLTVEYSGSLASDEESPVPGVRMAHIATDGAYLLLPGRWFPVTDPSSNRYTAVFHIEVPQGFTVVGTGTADPPAPAQAAKIVGPPAAGSQPPPGRTLFTFRSNRPEAAGTFVAGTLQLSLVKAEGVNTSVYTPASGASVAQSYGETAGRIVNYFSDEFGPLPQPNLSLSEIPDGGPESFSAPGLIVVSQHQWTSAGNPRVLANMIAQQWWGDQVMAATPSDAWLTDGLSRYCEALYIEQADGKSGMNRRSTILP